MTQYSQECRTTFSRSSGASATWLACEYGRQVKTYSAQLTRISATVQFPSFAPNLILSTPPSISLTASHHSLTASSSHIISHHLTPPSISLTASHHFTARGGGPSGGECSSIQPECCKRTEFFAFTQSASELNLEPDPQFVLNKIECPLDCKVDCIVDCMVDCWLAAGMPRPMACQRQTSIAR
eukprot:4830664-Pyramimonas_sp.AAC.1